MRRTVSVLRSVTARPRRTVSFLDVETALAHQVVSKAEPAYVHTGLLDQRKELAGRPALGALYAVDRARYDPTAQRSERMTEPRYVVGHFDGFPLRLSWLPRLVDRYAVCGSVPSNLETLACDLGIGKNMAKALRAWARAAGFLDRDGRITGIATVFFGHYDPYLERGESVALLHWLIVSNRRAFTAAAWVFNCVRSATFGPSDATTAFREHLAASGAAYSDGTRRGDIEPVLRMHAGWTGTYRDETDDRFFSQLRLLTPTRTSGRTAYSRTWEYERPQVSERLILVALLQSLASRHTASSASSELYLGAAGQPSPGTALGLSREGYYAALERLERDASSGISLTAMPGDDAIVTVSGDQAMRVHAVMARALPRVSSNKT